MDNGIFSAKEAIKLGTSPIIIDNTNTQKWEFKTYISMVNISTVEMNSCDTLSFNFHIVIE